MSASSVGGGYGEGEEGGLIMVEKVKFFEGVPSETLERDYSEWLRDRKKKIIERQCSTFARDGTRLNVVLAVFYEEADE